MVLIALLLAALVCLILGLVLASGPWLIGSLAASVIAGFVLWRQREQISGSVAASHGAGSPPTGAPPTGAPRQTSLVTGAAFAGKLDAAAAPPVPDVSVWVVDGRPDYHAQACPTIDGAGAEAVPLRQAVDDGFRECPTCTPVPGVPGQVWVIDGRPDYHRKDCARLTRGAIEKVSRGQAIEDGFTPCEQCTPDSSAPAETAPAEAPAESTMSAAITTDQVWVIDGRPRYHLQSCLIIKDQDAEPITLAQAIEDGFMPCSMCEPKASRV